MISKLKKASEVLKKEFVGLDETIDKVLNLITPWYLTPEVIERPVVISMWGMTGTGKTSLVRRLVELLDLQNTTLFVDCGQENKRSGDGVVDKISNFLNITDYDCCTDECIKTSSDHVTFVFDEFQYARTIDETGSEIEQTGTRAIWNIVDSGLINLDRYDYETTLFISFSEDIKNLASLYPDIALKNAVVEDRHDVECVLKELSYFYYDRGIYGMESENDVISKKDMLRPLPIIEPRILHHLVRHVGSDLKDTMLKDIFRASTITELSNILSHYRPIVIAPRYVECKNCLVFLLGNLDEAFTVAGEMSPDIDADIFHEETNKVTISDIKESLKRRYRAEQIARFGNSILKYPTLKKEHFKEIIRREVDRIITRSALWIDVEPEVYDLLYNEGVYPAQGVRPVFTTIGSIFTPLLSTIIVNDIEHAVIGIVDPESGYRMDKKTLYISGGRDGRIEIEIELVLGKLRNPKNRETRYACGVHEAGHAIALAYFTGQIPTNIVAVSVNNGGFCTKNLNPEIPTIRDIEDEIRVDVAGWLAESILFDVGHRLLGSKSDIKHAWDTLSRAAFNCGLFHPSSYSNHSVDTGGNIPCGFSSDAVEEKMKKLFDELMGDTEQVMIGNIKLLKKMAIHLGENGQLTSEEMLSFISTNFDGTLTLERLQKAKSSHDYNYYIRKLSEY